MADTAQLFEAIRTDDVGMVKRLVRQNPSLAKAKNEDGVSALLYARYANRIGCVDAILGVAPEMDVFEAAAIGSTSNLTEILSDDPSMAKAWSADGFTPVHYGAFFGHEDVVGILLPYGVELNVASKNELKVMPLHSAAASGHIGIVKRLVEHGADVNAKQQGGFTPLHEAAHRGDKDMADVLIKAGADLGARNTEGKTPAEMARENGHSALAEILAS